LEEILYGLTRRALADARLTIDDIDGIVCASCDQFDGRAIAIMAASGSVGGVGRDILSTPSSAEHAFVLGALRIGSGQYRTQLVISWSPLEAQSVPQVQQLGNDPYFHRGLPLDDLSSHALQAVALDPTHSLHDAALALVARNRAQGALAYPERPCGPREPVWIDSSEIVRWPLRRAMVAPPAMGAVALVLADAAFIAGRNDTQVAWIRGLGWAAEPAFLGDRDLATLPSLDAAAARAYGEAGITDAATQFDLAEVADATPYQQMIAGERLGLYERGSATAPAKQHVPINLSGGAASFNPVFCSGLMRIAEAAQQLRACAGAHQLDGARRAVAHGASGFAMQYNTVVVMESNQAGGGQ
ncbi:thiolase C-terminal domain-containing protein, partial [Paraburkholderia caffeinilytica]|uniref:thiolase C-terminal domain-containing protein n=1 Tax=Paraburkholderia caffeinilytica TaxID=1761016 RepID=UPI0038BBA2A3